ncbi:PQQ-dependent sugar dehydrogenase [Streptomyces sp. NPDC004457]
MIRVRSLTAATAGLLLAAAVPLVGTAHPAAASDNGQSVRPAMGWSSWSFVRRRPTEAKIKAQADALVSSGLKDHGFLYVNLDDFWQKCDGDGFVVDTYGRWAVDTAKFPDGIEGLADYVHSKGLKFGFYVTPGIAKNAVTKNTPIEGTSYHAKDIADTSRTEKNYNCKNMYHIDYSKPGAQEFVNSWARQFASWGVDYLKIDGVGSADIPDIQAWDKALRASGRPINFALSNNLPVADASTWRKLANSWRTQGDVECYCGPGSNGSGYPLTDWSHVAKRFDSAASWQPYAGPGGWNDLDSLEIGNGDQVGLTADQRRSHLTLWSMAAAPLLLGTDLTRLDPVDKAMLANDRLIGVDQDGVAAKRIVSNGVQQVWSKKESDGQYVVALFNTGTSDKATVAVNWSQVGFGGSGDVTDLWSGSHKGVIADSYSATLRPGETRLIRVEPVGSPDARALPLAGPGRGSAPAGTDYQAEDALISQGTVATNHTGYTGTGFVDYTNVKGSYVEFTVSAASAGTSALTLRYANGTSADRPMDISVNGTVVAPGVSFPATADWNTWATRTVDVPLAAGTDRIRATATTANGGPNLDRAGVDAAADTQAPTRPGQPSCSGIGEDTLTLAWGASSDNVGVSAYDVYEHGNKIGEAPGSSASKTLTGLTPNTDYNLTVIARDAAGNTSPASPVVDCTTRPGSDTTPPGKPGTLSASNVTTNSVDLKWGASTDDKAVVAYDVRSGTTVYDTVTSGTSTTLTGLACNSPYSLNVVARDAAGNVSEPGNTVSFTTKACATDGGVPSSIATLSTGWTIPWGTSWMPDGKSALVTERDDFRVWKVTKDGTKTRVGTVPNAVTTNGEGGLLGVAVGPGWDTDHYVYFMHTASEGNRVVRMTYDGTRLSDYRILLQGIKKNRYHNGGRLLFGPDGYLYVSTGEAQTPDLAQDKSSLNGKILRMTTDGKPAPGNPFGTYVYSLGHRNPQGLAFDRNGRLWEAEFGNSAKDELNLIKPGANYGWPICEGTCGVAGMTDPKATWNVSEASPSGIAIVRDVVYMASLRGERLWRIPINGDTESVGTPTAYYVGTYGRLRTVTKVPGADQLWLSTTNCDNNGDQPDGADKIFRVSIG